MPGDDQLGPAAEQAELGKPDAVDRRALGGEAGGAVVEVDLLDPDRGPGGDAASGAAAVGVRGDHAQVDAVELADRTAELVKPAGPDSVVVCQQDEHRQMRVGRPPTLPTTARRPGVPNSIRYP